jgi:hypothetical protein
LPQSASSPEVSVAVMADPILSASVYCSGRLCEVIQHLVAPFWAEYRSRSSLRTAYVWVMRYARCGEHLKIRVHGAWSEARLLRELLTSAQAEYLARLQPALPGDAPKSTPQVPPIDVEDRAVEDYPDRTFLWTAYLRSPLSLGDEPFLQDDSYLELLTRCLACGTEILLARLTVGPEGRCSYPLRRAIFLNALFSGLSSFRGSDRERSLYLLYHRDTLLRYLRRRGNWSSNSETMERVLARMDLQAERDPGREDLAKTLRRHEGADAAWHWQADLAAWRSALCTLEQYVAPMLGDPAWFVDPLADRPLFPVLFKVFHGFANQIGLNTVNEAFLFHLMAGVTAEPDLFQRPVRLWPQFEELDPEV